MVNGPLARNVGKAWSDQLSRVHAFNFYLILAVIVLHLLAIAAYAVFKKQNLLRPMITGKKRLPGATRAAAPRQPIARHRGTRHRRRHRHRRRQPAMIRHEPGLPPDAFPGAANLAACIQVQDGHAQTSQKRTIMPDIQSVAVFCGSNPGDDPVYRAARRRWGTGWRGPARR